MGVSQVVVYYNCCLITAGPLTPIRGFRGRSKNTVLDCNLTFLVVNRETEKLCRGARERLRKRARGKEIERERKERANKRASEGKREPDIEIKREK